MLLMWFCNKKQHYKLKKMEFKAFIYTGLKNKYPYNTIAYGSQILGFLILVLLSMNIISKNAFWGTLIFTFIFSPFVIQLFNFGLKEVLTYVEEIPLLINENSIKIGEKKYSWKERRNLEIDYSDYESKYIFRGRGDFRPNNSAGFNNYLFFVSKDGEQINHRFRLHSTLHIDTLRQVFELMAKQKTLNFEAIKKLYKPKNYKETQEIKLIYESLN
jgi:hypothetical protein